MAGGVDRLRPHRCRPWSSSCSCGGSSRSSGVAAATGRSTPRGCSPRYLGVHRRGRAGQRRCRDRRLDCCRGSGHLARRAAVDRPQRLRDPARHHCRAAAVPAPRAATAATPAVGGQQAGVHRCLPEQRRGVRRGVPRRRARPAVPGPRRADLVRGQVRHPDELPAHARARLPGRLGDDRGLRSVRPERPCGRRAARPAVRDRDRVHGPGAVDGPRRACVADLRAPADVRGDDLPGPADGRRGQLDGRGPGRGRRRRALAAAQPGCDRVGGLPGDLRALLVEAAGAG